jgi:hypothetical protein
MKKQINNAMKLVKNLRVDDICITTQRVSCLLSDAYQSILHKEAEPMELWTVLSRRYNKTQRN